MKVIQQFITPYIEQALALPREELDKLSHPDKDFTFLHAIARSTRDKKLIQDQLIAVLLAGRDTTAATLSWLFYEIARQPEIVRKIRAEVMSTVGPNKAPSYEDLKNMPYITHCINETLRLYPAVPFNIRQALTNTTLPGIPGQPDIAVLKGDIIAYSTLGMQRRRDLYPASSPEFANPAIYSPERWEKWSPRPWHYVPFNGGPRICVGQNFAMTEMAYTREFLGVRILAEKDVRPSELWTNRCGSCQNLPEVRQGRVPRGLERAVHEGRDCRDSWAGHTDCPVRAGGAAAQEDILMPTCGGARGQVMCWHGNEFTNDEGKGCPRGRRTGLSGWVHRMKRPNRNP